MTNDHSKRTPPGLTAAEIQRYGRHLVLPDVGREGQLRLKAASVLLVGTGGLGAPAGMYLAAAGIGRLGLVDFDAVEVSNLQRQVLFGSRDIGRRKVEAGRERLADLNPEIEITIHDERLTRTNAVEILKGYDIVVDGSDNFATRYLVNDVGVLTGRPVVFGSVYRFDGQVTVFGYEGGPCYRCLFPTPPPPGSVPGCVAGGVLGVLPGIIGALQANETIKIVLGKGATLGGRLLMFDALGATFREVRVERSPSCAVCGTNPSITAPIDYDAYCGDESGQPVAEITASELLARQSHGDPPLLIDVREPHESEICSIGGIGIPLAELPAHVAGLAKDRDIVLYCRTGVRSAHAVRLLNDAGFERVRSLRGGIYAWSDEVDPSVVKY